MINISQCKSHQKKPFLQTKINVVFCHVCTICHFIHTSILISYYMAVLASQKECDSASSRSVLWSSLRSIGVSFSLKDW